MERADGFDLEQINAGSRKNRVPDINASEVAIERHSTQIRTGRVEVTDIDEPVTAIRRRLNTHVCPVKIVHAPNGQLLKLEVAWSDLEKMCHRSQLRIRTFVNVYG